MAGDSGFDICYIGNPDENDLLTTIIKHDLYEPLDGYEFNSVVYSALYTW